MVLAELEQHPEDKARLQELRRGIDELDHQLLELLRQRLELVLQVGEIKRRHGIRVYDPVRERRVLDHLASEAGAPLEPTTARRLFERIIDECRSQEQHHISEEPE